MRKINIIKKLLVLLNISFIISLILTFALKNNFSYSLYWILVPVLIFLLMMLLYEVDKGQVDSDIDKSKMVKRSYNDTTTIATVFYGIVYLIIEFFDSIKINLKDNIYLIIGFFIITIIYELFIYLSISNANKETSDILNKKK
jgi:hypothetical protein